MKIFVQNWDREYEENTEDEYNGYVVLKWNIHAIAQIRWEIEWWRRGWEVLFRLPSPISAAGSLDRYLKNRLGYLPHSDDCLWIGSSASKNKN